MVRFLKLAKKMSQLRIPQRKRIFIGCEGESEQSYVALLTRHLGEMHNRVHLDAVVLNGGDPLAIIKKSLRKIAHRQSRGQKYLAHFVFLDTEHHNHKDDTIQSTVQLAKKSKIHLIWQEPNHEAFLLRHLPNCETLRPPTTALASQAIKREWPEYTKPMPALRLALRINQQAIVRVGSIDRPLKNLLEAIEFKS